MTVPIDPRRRLIRVYQAYIASLEHELAGAWDLAVRAVEPAVEQFEACDEFARANMEELRLLLRALGGQTHRPSALPLLQRVMAVAERILGNAKPPSEVLH